MIFAKEFEQDSIKNQKLREGCFGNFQIGNQESEIAAAENELFCWFSSNYNVEVHAYVKNKKYCVVNNTYEPQDTTVYTGDGKSFDLHLEANEIRWYQI